MAFPTLPSDVIVQNALTPVTANAVPTVEAVATALATVEAGGISDGDKGDITVSGQGLVWTVDGKAVSNAKLADAPAGTLKGRAAGIGTGVPQDLDALSIRSMLNVADGATQNATDAELRDRTLHTGLQTAATISDLTEAVQDVVGAMVVASGGTYNDPLNSITLPSAATVQDEGVTVSGIVTTFDFFGAGVTVTPGGAGESNVVHVNVPGAGSATISVLEGGALADASINAINVGSGIDVTVTPAGQANLNLDLSEYTAAPLGITGGGTGGGTAAAAKTALGLHAVATSGSAADLTGNLPIARLNGGIGATPTALWVGDNTWKEIATLGLGGGGSGNTNLGFTRDATTLTVTSDTGTDVQLPAATTSQAGVMSAAQATSVANAAPRVPEIENITAGAPYTVTVADSGKVKRIVDTVAQTINITTAFNGLGVVLQWLDGAGTPTLHPGAGVSLNGATSDIPGSAGRGAWVLSPVPGASNSWDVHGTLADFTAVDITDSTAVGRTLLTAANATAQRAALGLTPGTDVQAFDPDLLAIAGLTTAADRLPYFTGSAQAALATFTAAARALLDDADAATMRSTLAAAARTQVWDRDIWIDVPANQNYTVIMKSAVQRTVTDMIVRLTSGTCTVVGQIDGVAMTGASINGTSTEQAVTVTAANIVAVDQDLAITVSAGASPVGLRVAFRGTVALA